ncbi:MAG: hypothetical protein C0598_09480 [Marinilabiliales bacterium]|nr:MAG: hypothetical protein C0598_09480 [Marinilabiliales bacterium]
MASENKMKFCVIGCGNISMKYFIQALITSKNSDVVVCVDRTEKKKQLIYEQFGLPLLTDFSEALEKHNFDAVYIATPTGLHKDMALMAASNGKHILCEKSLASNLKDAREMIIAAKENNIALFEGFMYQFHNQNVYVQKLLNQGLIGDVKNVNAWFGFPKRDKNDFRLNLAKGGGGLIDAGAYPIHLARSIFRSYPTKVYANIVAVNDVDISGSVSLSFGEDKNALLSYSMDTFYKNKYELWGEKGNIRVERAFSVSPDYVPIINIETEKGKRTLTLESDNHFVKEIDYFIENASLNQMKVKWYDEMLGQAKLLEDIRKQN